MIRKLNMLYWLFTKNKFMNLSKRCWSYYSPIIYVENMICINCSSVNLRKKLSKGCLYIPINKKTDSIMRTYCKDYASIIDATNKDCSYIIERRRMNYVITTTLISLMLLVIVSIAIVNGAISIYRGVVVIASGLALILLTAFENEIACLLKKILAI